MRAHIADAIAEAYPRQLDHIAQQLWVAHGAGLIDDTEALELSEALENRRNRRRTTAPLSRKLSIFPPRRPQRSPDKAKSIARRRKLASSGPLPPKLACNFTVSELAVLKVVADEIVCHNRCALTLGEISARAGVCRTSAQNALRTAAMLGLIKIEERRRQGQKNLPNVIHILSTEWMAWLRLRPVTKDWVHIIRPHGYKSFLDGMPEAKFASGVVQKRRFSQRE